MPRTVWRPVFDASEAEQALGIVRDTLREADGVGEPSLCMGLSGLSLLHGYAARAGLSGNTGDRTLDFIDRAAEALEDATLSPWLADGFAGVGWTVSHLEQEGIIPPVRDRFAEIDDALEQLLLDRSAGKSFELLYGISGLGVYALERLPHPTGRRLLALVLDRLEESAERLPEGVTWRTDSNGTLESRGGASKGYYDLGVSHGIPGVIGFLAAACAAGVERRRAEALLNPAVAWLLSRQLPRELIAWFSSAIGRGTDAEPSRAAWCYGDPGIAAILIMAGALSHGSPWRCDALALARHSARRPPDECGVDDAGLCHGAAGLGHLFNRMYQATDDPELGRVARMWLVRAMKSRAPGEGVAGYRSLRRPNGSRVWQADAGFLTGAAGVALALLAGACPFEPSWDRSLLLSCRRAEGAGR